MRILALDISSRNTGWAIADDSGLVEWGDIPPQGDTHTEKLSGFAAAIQALITRLDADAVMIEDVWVGKNVLTMKILAYYHGVVLAECGRNNLHASIFTPSKFRKILGFVHSVQLNHGDRDAAKAAMRTLITALKPDTALASEDAIDACGIALAGHAWRQKFCAARAAFVTANPRVRSAARADGAATADADAAFQLVKPKKGSKK